MSRSVIAVVIHGVQSNEAVQLKPAVMQRCRAQYGDDVSIHWLPVHRDWIRSGSLHNACESYGLKSKLNYDSLRPLFCPAAHDARFKTEDSQPISHLHHFLEHRLSQLINQNNDVLTLSSPILIAGVNKGCVAFSAFNWQPQIRPLKTLLLSYIKTTPMIAPHCANDDSVFNREIP